MASGRSSSDDRILEVIFDPEAPLLALQEDGELEGGGGHSEQQQPAPREVREREVRAVQAAEEGRLDEALQLLNEAVAMAPDSASVYNNRAQVYQLRQQMEEALSDLNKAVELSGGRGKAGEQALCQRGIIWRVKGEEERALQDFKRAAKLGSRFAQRQVVQLNPYSALCNQMLTEAIGKLQRGEERT
ncbi:Tetratricopeptide repeat protein 36 [Geodia barretti]|uniref:Tetratricopeptide repeat protein 36 n=1 Tax=Geodia barretti TaxID=519541 RepID=A0AA35X2C6_GEOBA|nr:Tetratricopeptide repeat protein 36 [Geodia barretti]